MFELGCSDMKDKTILLGFSIPKGNPVRLPLHHLAIFGMTQLSGKTTALEALISRSELRAIAFKTKRGETGFHSYNEVQPHYRPRSDWQFVEGLVNVALQEKVKYEAGMRSAIMKACQGTRDLKEVQKKAEVLSKSSRTDFMRSVFERLVAYLDIVIPELEKWIFSETVVLSDGINVMDITGMRVETQQIVIASTIEYVYSTLSDVVVIIPEAWEMLPELRLTPVKLVAEQFIRKGASIRNYLWIDSQDIAGVSKVPLRQCDNWLMGRMKEAHEVERIIKQLLGFKISKEEIQTLPLGSFFVVVGDEVIKTYVLPNGVPESEGRKVATGKLTPEYIHDKYLRGREKEDDVELDKELQNKYEILKKDVEDLKEVVKQVLSRPNSEPDVTTSTKAEQPPDIDLTHKEIVVTMHHQERQVDMSTDNIAGRAMYSAIEDVSKEGFIEDELSEALKERGWNIGHNTLAPTLAGLIKRGYLVRILKTRPQKYRLPTKLKIIVEKGK